MKQLIKKIIPNNYHDKIRMYGEYIFNIPIYLMSQKLYTKFFGYKWHRNIDIIEIDITYDCNLKCNNCSRSCKQAPTKEHMTIKQIRQFISDSIDKDYQWKIIKLIGGEPTLHPKIEKIMQLLIQYKYNYNPKVELKIVSNGYGKKVKAILKKVPKEIQIINAEKKTNKQLFKAFNMAPIDNDFYMFADYCTGCPSIQHNGICLNNKGYFACPSMAGIDRILNVNAGYDRLPDYNKSLRWQNFLFCRYCGFYGYCNPKRITEQKTSETWKMLYEEYNENFIARK